MSDLRDEQWFTEVFDSHGSAFSLKVSEKLLDVQSPYQHLEVYATETYGNLMVLDGCVMLTDRDNFLYHEMIAHPALFTADGLAKPVASCATAAAALWLLWA